MLFKKFVVFALFFTLIGCVFVELASADVYVHGYYRKDGTYVKPHWRSDPDGNPYNNWSFPGNVNPYTGEVATGNPETYLKNYYKGSTSSFQNIPNLNFINVDTQTKKVAPNADINLEQRLIFLLRKLIKEGDVSVRLAAIEILATIGTPQAESLLKDTYKKEEEPIVKARILEKLCTFSTNNVLNN
jgi:hypothetical protein